MTNKLLEGIRVVDICVYRTGPITTKGLSDLGAEVIKVETRSRLRPIAKEMINALQQARTETNSLSSKIRSIAGQDDSLQDANGKLSITLNYASTKGLELTRRLIAKADIVVENHAAGTLKKRGLGYEDLKKIKPDIIMCSTCMQGQTGPYASHGALGHQLSALTGFNSIAGWPDREPGWLGPYTDFIAPRYNIIAILAALDYRARTGKGQFLDMSQQETGIQFISPLILDYAANGRIAGQMGNQNPYAAPHNAYKCLGEDRWCVISVFTDEEWQNFCKTIGNPGMAGNPRFATLLAQKENEQELDRIVNEWTMKRSAEEVMNLLQAAGVAAGVVETAEDQMDKNPQLKHRRFFRELDLPGKAGKYHSWTGAHFLLSKTPYELRRTPFVGEYNEYVFKDILGLSDDEYAELVKEKVID